MTLKAQKLEGKHELYTYIFQFFSSYCSVMFFDHKNWQFWSFFEQIFN